MKQILEVCSLIFYISFGNKSNCKMKFLGRIKMPLREIVTLENSIPEKITPRDINEK